VLLSLGIAFRAVRRRPAYALPLGLLIFGLTSAWMESGMVTVMLPSFLAGCCLLRMSLYEAARTKEPRDKKQEAKMTTDQ
jgi:hypothetical protein